MGLCREIYQEGVRIPPVKLMRAGLMNRDVLAMLLNNVRTPEEREGDLGAQIAACHTGAERLREVCSRYGLKRARGAAAELLDYSEELMRAFLQQVPGRGLSGRRFSGWRRDQRRPDQDRSYDSTQRLGPGLMCRSRFEDGLRSRW